MSLESDVARILNDPRLDDEDADVQQLIAAYGAETKPEAIYKLAATYGWRPLYDILVAILRDDGRRPDWEPAQIVLFYAARDHQSGAHHYPMPADSTIALLYSRFADGLDDGDRIWSIVCALKGVEHWSDYDPMQDPGVLHEMKALKDA